MSGILRDFVRTILEVDEKVIQYVNKMKASVLPFESVFQGKKRIAIPAPSKEINAIVKKLEKKGYEVDLVNNMATKSGQTIRLGKVIGRELGQKVVDAFAKSGGAMSIIISRAPIDVLRMSDFEQIQSCHSQGGEFFNCSIKEAEQGGAVAFVVRNKDLKTVDLEADEIFEDDERNIPGIKPFSRMRLRRFMDMEDLEDIAVPDTVTYGHEIKGFQEALTKWAKETQSKMRSKKKNRRWTMVGAVSDDRPRQILKKAGVVGVGGSGHVYEEQPREVLSQQIQQKISEKYSEAFQKWSKEIKSRMKTLSKEKKVPIQFLHIDIDNKNLLIRFEVGKNIPLKMWNKFLGGDVYSINVTFKDDKMEKKVQEFLKKLALFFDYVNEEKEKIKKMGKKTGKKSKKKKGDRELKVERLKELIKYTIEFELDIYEIVNNLSGHDVRANWIYLAQGNNLDFTDSEPTEVLDRGTVLRGGNVKIPIFHIKHALGFYVNDRARARRYFDAYAVTQYINTLREMIIILESWAKIKKT